MSDIKQHLKAATLSEYASGTLNSALEVAVACHLTYCSRCREHARKADDLGGYFLDDIAPEVPSIGAAAALENIKSRLSFEGQDPVAEKQTSNGSGTSQNPADPTSTAALHGIPLPLARQLPAKFEDLDWKPLAKGIQQVDLKPGSGKKDGAFKLLKLQPGTELIEHTHGDHEMTLVLQGSYSDGFGHYGVGDIADLGAEDSHKPVIDSDIPCIALIASNSPARYHGLMGRIIQPFVDI